MISIFTYDPVTAYDESDALQRFGKLKIEATSFTISEPTTSLEISPMLYNLATESEKKILCEQYDVMPFSVKTITMERIFISGPGRIPRLLKRCDEFRNRIASFLIVLEILSFSPRNMEYFAIRVSAGMLFPVYF